MANSGESRVGATATMVEANTGNPAKRGPTAEDKPDRETRTPEHQHHPYTLHGWSAEGEQRPSGHADGARPLTYVIFDRFLRHSPSNPHWPNRDRFVLSNGHASMLLYSMLHLTGYDLSLDDLKQFRQWGSKTPGHPEYGLTPGVETTTGPLGQGVAQFRRHGDRGALARSAFQSGTDELIDYRVYAICGDGDMMEGISQRSRLDCRTSEALQPHLVLRQQPHHH